MKLMWLIIFPGIFLACSEPVIGKDGVIYKNPAQYNDYIVSRQTKLMKNIIDFGKMVAINHDSAELLLHRYVGETEMMINEIRDMPPYKKDSSLRDAAIHSFSFYKRVFGHDYMQILSIRKKQGQLSDGDMQEISRILDTISKEEGDYFAAFQQAQNEFANKHKMELKENNMQD